MDQRLLEELLERLRKKRLSGVILSGFAGASYQHRFRTSSVLIDDGPVKNAADVRRAYLGFSPFLRLGAGIGKFTGLSLEAEAAVRPPWQENYEPDHNFMPLPTVDIAFDLFPKGVLAWNGENVNAALGRDKAHIGPTPGGTLYPSGNLPYLDGIRLFTSLGPFSFDYLLSTIQPKRNPRRDVYDTDLDHSVYETGTTYQDYFGFMDDPHPSIILTAMHRFQWNFGPVKAGLGNTVVYARSSNMYLFTDILPLASWHNADIRPNNISLIVDLSWAFYPGFTLSGMLGFDDINARFAGLPDGDVPTIPAGIIQLEYSRSGEKVFMDFLLEGGYTHYLWGNFGFKDEYAWGEAPLARAIYRYAPNNEAVFLPLTSPYGPGTAWGRLTAAVLVPSWRFKAGADLLVLSKTRGVNLVETPYENNGDIRSGARLLYVSLDLPCTYTWRFMEFLLSPALLIRDGRAAFECTLGFTARYGGNRAFGK